MKKFQLDFTNVPKALHKTVQEETQKILIKNGWENTSFLDKRINGSGKDGEGHFTTFLIFGFYEDGWLAWNPTVFEPNNYPVYDVLKDWETWTKFKFKRNIEIQTDDKEYPVAIVSKDNVRVGCKKFSFDFIHKLHEAVIEMEKK